MMQNSRDYDYYNDLYAYEIKHNAGIISQRIKKEAKSKKISRDDMSKLLGYARETISRKYNNNGNHFVMEDICSLSDKWNYRIEYLLCIDNFRTEYEIKNAIYEKKHNEKDYKSALDYFDSIGVHLHPAIYWVGTEADFITAYWIIKDYLSDYSLKKAKDCISDTALNFTFNSETKVITQKETLKKIKIYFNDYEYSLFNDFEKIFLPLTDNPLNNNMIKVTDLSKSDSISDLNIDFKNASKEELEQYAKESPFVKQFEKYHSSYRTDTIDGVIEIRYRVILDYDDYYKDEYITIDVDNANSLFNHVDTMCKTLIQSLFTNSIHKYIE